MSPATTWARRAIFTILVAVVVLAPLPFGSNRPWSWSLLSALAAGLTIAWAAFALRDPALATVSIRHIRAPAVLFLAAVAWALVQLASFVPEILAHPLWPATAALLNQPIDGRITLNPFLTGTALMRLLGYGGVFFLSLQLCRRRRYARFLAIALILAELVYASYGLVTELSGANRILWFAEWAYTDRLNSVFVNPNSYATYAGIGLVLVLCLYLDTLAERLDTSLGTSSARRVLRDVIEHGLGQYAWLILAFLIIASALALTASRGGVASALIGLLVAVMMFALARGRGGLWLFVLGTTLFVGAAAAMFEVSGAQLSARLVRKSITREDRFAIWQGTLDAIRDAPLLGSGYGAFPDLFRLYRAPSLDLPFNQAHNTYLELAVGLGVPVAAALIVAVVLLVGRAFLGVLRRRRDGVYPAMGVSAAVVVGSHALTDFSVQIPAVAVTFSAILGMSVAQSWSSRDNTA